MFGGIAILLTLRAATAQRSALVPPELHARVQSPGDDGGRSPWQSTFFTASLTLFSGDCSSDVRYATTFVGSDCATITPPFGAALPPLSAQCRSPYSVMTKLCGEGAAGGPAPAGICFPLDAQGSLSGRFDCTANSPLWVVVCGGVVAVVACACCLRRCCCGGARGKAAQTAFSVQGGDVLVVAPPLTAPPPPSPRAYAPPCMLCHRATVPGGSFCPFCGTRQEG
jgi:hypothetical protein